MQMILNTIGLARHAVRQARLLVLVILVTPSLARAGLVPEDYVEPQADPEYARIVAEMTTNRAFISPLTATLPDHPEVPSPREFLGYVVGTPGKLTYYTEIHAYLQTLADKSARVILKSMGRSNEGREMIVVFVADEEILARLDQYAEYTGQLADPRSTSDSTASHLFAGARPFYYLTGGLHSTETGSPEMLMELAYRLAVGESPLIRRIRSNVITMITPVVETDGRERMVDWYYNVTMEHDDWNDMPPKSPPYWGKYVLHDNNRDGLQLTQPLTRNVFATFFAYHPQVLHDLHESVPLLYVSAGTGPYNTSLDPIVTSEWQWLSNYEVTEMTKLGLPGVWTWGFYTGWWPGYLMWVANNHNSMGRFYETFGNAGASTFQRELKEKFAGKKVTTKLWYRPWPPDKKVEWSFRNSIDFMESGVLAALDFASQNRKGLLFNFWKKGLNSLERGRTEAPFAWIIPRANRNNYELSYLIDTLRGQRIEVHTADEDIKIGDSDCSKGDFIVRMDQPYRDYALSLMETQHFPDDAEHQPYDDVAWTLPLLYGVDAYRVDDASILDRSMSLLEGPVSIAQDPPRQRKHYVIPASSSSRLIEARYRLRGFDVYAADTTFSVREGDFAAGSWLVSSPDNDRDEELYGIIQSIASELGLKVSDLRSFPEVRNHSLDIPRIAVYHTWFYTQDSGWVRYTFDRAGIPYTLIDKDDVRDGHLRRRFDVVIIPNTATWNGIKELIHGIDPKWGKLPWTKSAATPNFGDIDQSDDITGGMGFEGLVEFGVFIDDGGTLVTLGAASSIPIELGLVRHVDRINPSGFSNPGSVVRSSFARSESPLVAGYSEPPNLFRGNLPLFKVDENYQHYVVLRYGDNPSADDQDEDEDRDQEKKEPVCLSGMVKGEKNLDGKPAILDIPRGKGRVIAFSFNPMHRYLNVSNFALAYNAILNWND